MKSINNCVTYTDEHVEPKSYFVEFNTFEAQEYPDEIECAEALELHQNVKHENIEFIEYEKIGTGRVRAIFHSILKN